MLKYKNVHGERARMQRKQRNVPMHINSLKLVLLLDHVFYFN